MARFSPFGIRPDDMNEVMAMEFADLDTRAALRLMYDGYRTLAQVCVASDVDLLAIPYIGKTKLAAIRDACARAGRERPTLPCPHCGGTGRVRASSS